MANERATYTRSGFESKFAALLVVRFNRHAYTAQERLNDFMLLSRVLELIGYHSLEYTNCTLPTSHALHWAWVPILFIFLHVPQCFQHLGIRVVRLICVEFNPTDLVILHYGSTIFTNRRVHQIRYTRIPHGISITHQTHAICIRVLGTDNRIIVILLHSNKSDTTRNRKEIGMTTRRDLTRNDVFKISIVKGIVNTASNSHIMMFTIKGIIHYSRRSRWIECFNHSPELGDKLPSTTVP